MLRSSEIKPLFVDLSLRDKSFSFFCILRVFLSILWHSFFHLLSDSLYYKTHFLAWFIYIFFFVSFFVFFYARLYRKTCIFYLLSLNEFCIYLCFVVLSMACGSLYGLCFSLWLVVLSMTCVSLYGLCISICNVFRYMIRVSPSHAYLYGWCVGL